jgi:hypothetical protein
VILSSNSESDKGDALVMLIVDGVEAM